MLESDQNLTLARSHEQGGWTEAVRLCANDMEITEQKAACHAHLKRLGRKTEEVGLVLSSRQVLRKRLKLPLAVEENIRQVLGYEMDRHTPFKADQVYFDYRVIGRDTKAGQLDVQLVVVPRQHVDAAMKQASEWGVAPQGIWLVDELQSAPPCFNLNPQQQSRRKTSRFSWTGFAMGGVAVALILTALIFPVWQKRDLAIRLLPEVDQAHQQADVAEKLRIQAEGLLAEYEYILAKKREFPPVVAVLDDLTKILPDDTWVRQLDIKGKELQLQGDTGSSSNLIALFEKTKTLHGANFRAPLIKAQSGTGEQFHLAVETRPLGLSETAWQPPVVVLPPPAPPAAPAEPDKAVQPADVQTIPKLEAPPVSGVKS